MKKMTVLGSGILAGVIVFPYFILTLLLSRIYKPVFNISFISEDTLFVAGLILLIIGVSVYGSASSIMSKAVEEDKLAKGGAYSVFLNPVLSSQLLLSVPGVALMTGSWLVLTTMLTGIVVLKLFSRYKENYLQEKFGQEYIDYREKVLIKFL